MVPVLALAEQIGLPDVVADHLVIKDAASGAGALHTLASLSSVREGTFVSGRQDPPRLASRLEEHGARWPRMADGSSRPMEEAVGMATPTQDRQMSVVQPSANGIGAMVGAGVLALLGAGAMPGAAGWLSFLLVAAIAAPQGCWASAGGRGAIGSPSTSAT